MLEKVGLRVKVLRMQGAKDPDEFLKKYGADRFSLLLDKSENQAEYQLESLKRKYDLTDDEQRVEFFAESRAAHLHIPECRAARKFTTRARGRGCGHFRGRNEARGHEGVQKAARHRAEKAAGN